MNKVIAIVGPTGVGKTKLSVKLAHLLDGEVINADSTQVYRGLDIATAKIQEVEKEGIVHHLFDIKDTCENYTVYDYQKDARMIIDDILKRGKTPILVGGTGLYIKAVLYDYEFHEERLLNNYDDISNDKLYSMLKAVDPNTLIHPNNRKRVIRALNYFDTNKKPFSDKEKTEVLLYDSVIIGLTTDREKLYDIINKRTDKMIESGLIDEARRLYDLKPYTKAILTPIGYKELFGYFDNQITLEDAINNIKQGSRKYAKRQYTWFNNQMNVKWFDVNFDDFDKTILEVLNYIKKES